jgi:hypothetical protein
MYIRRAVRSLTFWITQCLDFVNHLAFERANGSLDGLDLSTMQLTGAPKWESAGLNPPQPKKAKFKNIHFVDTTISKILRDLRFSLNQPLKSADDW